MTREHLPEPHGRFATRRDEALYALVINGWANRSSGRREASTGFFASISNSPEEVGEVMDALAAISDLRVERAKMIGHFLLTENTAGYVGVIRYGTEQEQGEAYDKLEAEYQWWVASER